MSAGTVPVYCPNESCGRLLATTGTPHCPTATRDKPCGWVACINCRTVIDSRTGRHMPGGRP